MSVIEAIRNRRSVRKYQSKSVEAEKLESVLEAARLAPSGHNVQPWHFIVVQDPEIRKRVSQISHQQNWMARAPVHIACVADISMRLKDRPDIVVDEESPEEDLKRVIRDTTIATEHMVLQAQELGLSTCWVAWYRVKEIREVLGLPADKYVVAIITLGYPDESPEPKPRRSLEDVVHQERWQSR